jgi:thimet oligopeptidase
MNKTSILILCGALLVALAAGAPHYGAASVSEPRPFWNASPDVATFEKNAQAHLAQARQELDRLRAVKGKRTVENTVKPYDEALRLSAEAMFPSGLFTAVHPDESLRAAAEKAEQQAGAFYSELFLDREIYQAFAAIDLNSIEPVLRDYIKGVLRIFRSRGVDKDDETRRKIKALDDKLTVTAQEFSRNINNDKRTIIVNEQAELAGLPADYLARHQPDAQGKIKLTTDNPDVQPVLTYATNAALRQRMYTEFRSRAWPQNMAVLDRLIAERHESARLSGFANYADSATFFNMVGNGKNAAEFLERVEKVSRARAEREYQELLKRKQREVPGANVVHDWEQAYWAELVRKADYDFDSQATRPYFPFARVKQGVFDLTSKLFGVTYRQVKDAPVWHPSVECWEILEGGKVIGRFYLDLHPRNGKYQGPAQFLIRSGVAGKQLPEAALVCNFRGDNPGDPGLMQHSEVKNFFHEFGHLLHEIFGGRHRWINYAGTQAVERDFVEVPSKMLEEWVWNPATLATFARHYQTGAPISAELVNRMKRAANFGKGLTARRQLAYAKFNLSVFDRDPAQVNTDALYQAIHEKYLPFPFVEGTHFQTSFSHLVSYGATYYTYLWSEVIAKDLFSQFNQANLLDPRVAQRYRDTVLAPGGSRPAEKLVANFLGRPYSFKAWQKWLEEEN